MPIISHFNLKTMSLYDILDTYIFPRSFLILVISNVSECNFDYYSDKRGSLIQEVSGAGKMCFSLQLLGGEGMPCCAEGSPGVSPGQKKQEVSVGKCHDCVFIFTLKMFIYYLFILNKKIK